MENLASVAIIGRPNVGKSTLFNSIIQERKSIVSDIPGTTRDRVIHRVDDEIFYFLVDTAGLTDNAGHNLEEQMNDQVNIAVHHADLIIFIADAKSELTSDDHEVLNILRRSGKPTIFVANKVDDGNVDQLYAWTELGLGMPFAISALNHYRVWDLQDEIQSALKKLGFKSAEAKETSTTESSDKPIRVAIIGRPNVGKSSLANAIFGDDRSIVSDEAGTTRDMIDRDYTDPKTNQKFTFLDTAGLRRPGKIGREIEFWSSVRSSRSIEIADTCLLIIDALDGVTHQDLAVAGKALQANKGIVIVVNKIDLVQEKSRTTDETDTRELDDIKMWGEKMDIIQRRFLAYLHQKIAFLPWAPVHFLSAKTHKGVDKIFPTLQNIKKEREKFIKTQELHEFIKETYYAHVTPTQGNYVGKIKHMTQVDTCPPRFLIFVNRTEAFHFSYRRYIENRLREKYGFFGTPVEIEFRVEEKKERK